MTRYLDIETVTDLNADHGGQGAGLIDPAGLDAAIHRPQHDVFGQEVFATVWLKAAALLHGIASTQYFSDGNKRTGWLAAELFLEVNGHPLGFVDEVAGHAFVLGVAAGAIEMDLIAEWLQVHAEVGYSYRDPRVHYAFLARDASVEGGTFHASYADTTGFMHPGPLPFEMTFSVVCCLKWGTQDIGKEHVFRGELHAEDGTPLAGALIDLMPPVFSGHPAFQDGVMPAIIALAIRAPFEFEQQYSVCLYLDDDRLATLPYQFTLRPEIPDGAPTATA